MTLTSGKATYRTLFLDRDGVINVHIKGYVTHIDKFEFLPGVLEVLKELSGLFKHIIIVTNQQGIGKGVFSMDELNIVHQHMLDVIQQNGGRIDKIYVAPELESENSMNRKPEIGMALQARQDFPDIDFATSVMVGDSLPDMQFGKKAGMRTVYLTDHKPIPDEVLALKPDAIYEDLPDYFNREMKI